MRNNSEISVLNVDDVDDVDSLLDDLSDEQIPLNTNVARSANYGAHNSINIGGHCNVTINQINRAFLHKIGAQNSDACPCGAAQTIEHIINSCHLCGAPHGTAGLVDLDTDTVAWLNTAIPV